MLGLIMPKIRKLTVANQSGYLTRCFLNLVYIWIVRGKRTATMSVMYPISSWVIQVWCLYRRGKHAWRSQLYKCIGISFRPLHCPHKDCNRTIAVSSLDSHFRYEHKYVAFIDTHLEARNGLEFFIDDVKLNEILCVVIINIMDKAEVHPVISR